MYKSKGHSRFASGFFYVAVKLRRNERSVSAEHTSPLVDNASTKHRLPNQPGIAESLFGFNHQGVFIRFRIGHVSHAES